MHVIMRGAATIRNGVMIGEIKFIIIMRRIACVYHGSNKSGYWQSGLHAAKQVLRLIQDVARATMM
jgi:hypothetical protein